MSHINFPISIEPGQPVIFDMDGVLVDTEPLNEQHMTSFLQSLGVTDPEPFDTELKGFNSQTIWILLKQKYNLPQSIDELTAESRRHYLLFLESKKLPIIPGAIELVQYLHTIGCKLAIGSSASSTRINIILEKLKLTDCFPVIVSGDDIARSKPAPDVFSLAAEKLSVNPTDCIVIEDAHNGVEAAKAAGMTCIAYAGSEHNHDDLSSADLIIKDFNILISTFKDIVNGQAKPTQ